MFKEFKNFIARGNVIDMAVGIVMGAAFTAIVNSAVGDILMPIVGWMMAGVDFSNYFVQLGGDQSYATLAAAKQAGAPVISYGMMINAVINFLAVAWFVFWIVKGTNKLKKKEEESPSSSAPTPEDIVLLREIRDSLKK
ncbi:MAG: large conductance mechanosensitive channel protein MscL [Alphaproteobacteria bacterium]|jgi:large conductance mechanosensitive channel|nr:large conductance mechanosensitive channel protein MscL [Alphaproteobacteria bacterium]MCB9985529.1 large conductance mechanosensitive channel protein MscL [Micavibrio sp.]HPQ51571.1 large conductance mechanosensitive channel protein MscL [Alphaproteobacteria bacterium]